MNRDGSGMTRITHLNEAALEGRYVAEPHRVDYTSCGYDLRGWVLLPQGYSPRKKYPAVLDVHGGPRCAYGETFFHEMQLWVAKGYVVFFTNIKGSDGRGDAFADIRGDYGGTDFQNLMDFTDAVLKAYPNIDPKRVCETGGSYGGFMTNWIIGHTDRFCCAASQRSISNWVSMSFISDIGAFFSADQYGRGRACSARGDPDALGPFPAEIREEREDADAVHPQRGGLPLPAARRHADDAGPGPARGGNPPVPLPRGEP